MDQLQFVEIMTREFKDFLSRYDIDLRFTAPFNADAIGRKCSLKFIRRLDDFVCEIIDPNDSEGKNYFLGVVFSMLYPDETVGKGNKFGLTENIIRDMKMILQFPKMKQILLGDFSWKQTLKKQSEDFSAKRKFLLNHLPVDHPIAQKASIGDVTWLDDIDHLMQ